MFLIWNIFNKINVVCISAREVYELIFVLLIILISDVISAYELPHL
jgi:hypothetical protein